jgi:hypothetical protein
MVLTAQTRPRLWFDSCEVSQHSSIFPFRGRILRKRETGCGGALARFILRIAGDPGADAKAIMGDDTAGVLQQPKMPVDFGTPS